MNESGKAVCARCAANPPTAESVTQQQKSYWVARVARELDGFAKQLKTDWCQTLYTDFVEQEVGRTDPMKIALSLERYLIPFSRLESALPGIDAVNPSSLLQLFSGEDMRRHETVFRFLQNNGIEVPDQRQRRNDSDWRRIHELLNSLTNPDHALLLDRFFRERYRVGVRASPKTKRIALQAAVGLLSVSRNPIPNQDDIQRYLKRVPGQRAALSAFVGFLKSAGTSVTIPHSRRSTFRRNSEDIAVCIAMLDKATDYAQLRAAAVGTLLGLLGLPLSDVVRLPRSSLRNEKDHLLFTLEGDEIALDRRLHQGFGRYLAHRGQGENSAYLFPGRNPHHPVSEAAITYHFSEWGVSTRGLTTDARQFLRRAAAKSN